jgi:hypothetical protein
MTKFHFYSPLLHLAQTEYWCNQSVTTCTKV